MAKRKSDIEIGGCNGMYMITPITQAGKAWVEENVQYEGWQCLGPSIGVDNGALVEAVTCGAIADGLVVNG